MRLTRLIVLTMAIVTSVGFFMLYSYLTDDLESQTFQATEEALVDTAHIVSGIIEADIEAKDIQLETLAAGLKNAHNHTFKATIYNLKKDKIGSHFYITNKSGIVIYDSNNELHLGEDLSDYNDVILANKNIYAARSTRTDASDPDSSILYIGVPITHQGEILGTLTVYKAQKDVLPFISSRRKWISLSLTMIALGMIVFTISVFAWIFRPIGKLTRYAHAITRDERPNFPKLGRGREVNTLGTALKDMRESLDGKSYVEDYTQILTHELKSPLAAIRASSELLSEDMPMSAEQRTKFFTNIRQEADRSQRIIDGLLRLSQLEAQPQLLQKQTIDLLQLAQQLKDEHTHRLAPKNIHFEINIPTGLTLQGDSTLFKAALANLLENAIHFSPVDSSITLSAAQNESLEITLTDHGPGIPAYALERIFDRFYSVSKPNTKHKSSGLGLSFVKEIIKLHHGNIALTNNSDQGSTATIRLGCTG